MECSSYHNDKPTECGWQYYFDLQDQIDAILEENNVNKKDTDRISSLVMEILDELDSVIGDRHMDCPTDENEVMCTYNTYG